MAVTNQAEVIRKAQAGIPLADTSNKDNVALYNQVKSQVNADSIRNSTTNTASTSGSNINQSIISGARTNGIISDTTQKKEEYLPYDPTTDIEKLKQAQVSARISQLQSAKDSALSNLSGEKANIAPMYAGQRNDVTTKNMIDKMNFAEYLTATGGNSQGSADQLNLASNIALQNNISGLKQAEAQDLAANDRRVTDVNNAFETDKVNALADIESNTMQALINAKQQADTTNYARQQTAQETAYQKQQDQLKNDVSSIGAYYGDYAAEIQRRKAINPNDPLIPYLEAARQQKIQDQQTEQKKLADTQYENALKIYQTTGVATPEIAKILGIPAGTKTEDMIKTQYTTNKPYYKPTSGTSGTGGTKTTKQYSNYYSGYISENLNTDGEAMYKNLVENKDSYTNEMGSANYIKAVQQAQNKYYNTLISRWRDKEEALKSELKRKPQYYQEVLGLTNYNKLMSL